MFDSIRSKIVVAGAALLAPVAAFAETTLPDVGQAAVTGYLTEGIIAIAAVIGVAVGAAVAFWVVRAGISKIRSIAK